MLKLIVHRAVDGRIVEVTATYSDDKWACDSAEFLADLNIIRPHTQPDYEPDPPLALVEYVARLYVGKVIDTRGPARYREDVVY